MVTTPRNWSTNSSAYTRSWLRATVFSVEILDERSGLIAFSVQGQKADQLFKDEAGGHRWQRVPPNEKRGRVHTSTVTVAVLPEPTEVQVHIDERDIEWIATKGSGAGGQKRNKTSSAVIMKHKPSGLSVRCESERSQHQNRSSALALLRARLWQVEKERAHGQVSQDRKAQVGSGQRGDKRRTIRTQDGVVHDHVTGRRWRLKEYLRGEW